MIDIVNSEEILNLLSESLKDKIIITVLDKTTSTNTIVKECAMEKSEGFFVVAGEQTAGRGRMGRTFFSPGNTGIYMSLLLKPSFKAENAVHITTAAAVSVCRALEKVGVDNPCIKWVNDIFVNGKKVCGILTEAGFSNNGEIPDYAVLGVGINVYEPQNGFPQDIEDIAGSLFPEEKTNLRNKIVAYFLESFFEFYGNLLDLPHSEEYASRNFVVGKDVTVVTADGNTSAKVLGVTRDCGLQVQFSDGTEKVLTSGEISVRLQ